jgi:hypothetical protein
MAQAGPRSLAYWVFNEAVGAQQSRHLVLPAWPRFCLS